MKKQPNNIQVFIGILIAALGFLPAAALARDGQDSRAPLSVNISTYLKAENSESGSSINATTTAGIRDGDKNYNSDDNNENDEVLNTKHRESVNSRQESDEDEGEIEIDHDSADNATTTIDAPERVTNHGQLRSFLNHIVKGDDRISDVHVSSSTIETHYKIPAKFLWTIPMNLTADVVVNSDGSVTVTYPWYAFLFTKHDSELATKLEQSISSTGTATLSANAQAHLLNLLFLNLKTSTE